MALTDGYVGFSEAARYLGVHRATLTRWADAGALASYRVGPNRRLLRISDLDALIVEESAA